MTFGNDTIVHVIEVILFPVIYSIPLPPIVALLTNVVPPVSVVVSVHVRMMLPVCPGCNAPTVRIVGVAEMTPGSVSLMTTPDIVAPHAFP
ncbi:MAG: hypothetical protein WCG98_09915 [bacterium]